MYFDTAGKKRKGIKANCIECDGTFFHRLDIKQRCCSAKCSRLNRRTRIEINCHTCGSCFSRAPSKMLLSKSGLQFCSRKCKEQAQSIAGGCSEIQPDHYGTGRWNYRERAFAAFGERCSACGYDQHAEGLQVHHIDYNHDNSELENLIVLCITCHVLIHRKVITI